MAYQIPTYETPLTSKGQTQSSWYRFFLSVWQGAAPSNETTLKVGGSPFSYTAPSRGYVLLKGGTVSAVQVMRSVTTLTGLTAGIFPLSQGDVLVVTYSALPTMVFFSQ